MAAHLCKVLLGDPSGPLDAQVQGAARVGHVSTLNHHALDQDLVFRKGLPSRVALTVAALTLENMTRSGLVKPTEANSPGAQAWQVGPLFLHPYVTHLPEDPSL